MNNKPVAWMIKRDENITKGMGHEIQLTLMDATKPEFWIEGKIAKGYEVFPLYTHPSEHDLGIAEAIGFEKGYKASKPADLTDEEIIVCMGSLPKYNSEIVDEDLVKFARAILRKAQKNE